MKAALLDSAVTLAILLSACEGEEGAIDAGSPPPPIVGDWFTCQRTCEELHSGGLRFTVDLHVHHLVSPDRDDERCAGPEHERGHEIRST